MVVGGSGSGEQQKTTTKDERREQTSGDEEAKAAAWPRALSDFIRRSDEQLLGATLKLLGFFEGDLAPVQSMTEFLDVIGEFRLHPTHPQSLLK